MPSAPVEPVGPADPAAPGTRDRLVRTMTGALARRGLHGIGLTELLARAGAPKGVLYHHFPGGKTELALEAVRVGAARVVAGLDALTEADGDPAVALRAWFTGALDRLEGSGFERGCPLATVALESTPDDVAMRAALAEAFAAVRDRLTTLLWRAGAAPDRAAGLAALIVATYEGALMQARVAGSAAPMRQACDTLVLLVDSELGAAHARAARAARADRGDRGGSAS